MVRNLLTLIRMIVALNAMRLTLFMLPTSHARICFCKTMNDTTNSMLIDAKRIRRGEVVA